MISMTPSIGKVLVGIAAGTVGARRTMTQLLGFDPAGHAPGGIVTE
jgi:hypothetical protein